MLPSLVSMQGAKKNSLTHNFFFLGIVQVINVLLQLLVIPYVIKTIGVDGFGQIAVAQVVMLFLSVFTDYSFNQAATREISLNRNEPVIVSEIFYRALFCKMFLCFLTFILLVVLVVAVPLFRSQALLYLLAFVFVIGQSLFVNWFFQGLEKMHFVALLTLLARVVFVTLVFVFIKGKEDSILYLFFWGCGNFIAGLAGIYLAHRMLSVQFKKPGWRDIQQELKEGWHITVANFSIYACQYANVFILRIFTNDLTAGYYSIAEKIFLAMKQGLAIFSQAIYPKVCLLIQLGRGRVIQFFRQSYLPFLGGVITICTLVFILAAEVLRFFIGNQSGNSLLLLRFFSIATIIVCLNIPPGLILLATDRKKNYLRIIVLGTTLNIIANIILVNFLGAKGTVISILVTELFITIGLCREVHRLYLVNRGESKSIFRSFFMKANNNLLHGNTSHNE